jgi:hypothetical protein
LIDGRDRLPSITVDERLSSLLRNAGSPARTPSS